MPTVPRTALLLNKSINLSGICRNRSWTKFLDHIERFLKLAFAYKPESSVTNGVEVFPITKYHAHILVPADDIELTI